MPTGAPSRRLSDLVFQRFGLDPLSRHLFFFRNQRGDRGRSWRGIDPRFGSVQVA
jgi:hypothetical protein